MSFEIFDILHTFLRMYNAKDSDNRYSKNIITEVVFIPNN